MTSRNLLTSLILLALLSLLCSIKLGVVNTPWLALLGHGSQHVEQIIWQLRWPIALNAFVTGSLLALTGAILQILLRNPLADPYILGISGGAATANLTGILLGISSHWLHLTSFMGALIATLLLYWLLYRQRHVNPQKVLLAGVIMAAGWGAIISLLLAISPNQDLRSMLFWLMGDVNNYSTPWFALTILLLATIYSALIAPQLNILMQGNQQAQSLGINVQRLQTQLYFVTALLTATAVSIAGTIGFVGLITPHLLRLLHTSDHKFILPASMLLGGSLVCFANLLAKQALLPIQLPVGVVMALIGVPVFLILLCKQ